MTNNCWIKIFVKYFTKEKYEAHSTVSATHFHLLAVRFSVFQLLFIGLCYSQTVSQNNQK